MLRSLLIGRCLLGSGRLDLCSASIIRNLALFITLKGCLHVYWQDFLICILGEPGLLGPSARPLTRPCIPVSEIGSFLSHAHLWNNHYIQEWDSLFGHPQYWAHSQSSLMEQLQQKFVFLETIPKRKECETEKKNQSFPLIK